MSTLQARRARRTAIAEGLRAHRTSQKRTHPLPAKPPLTVRFRGPRLPRADTHVRYGVGVGERTVDRDAWAQLVAQLINQEAAGNNSAFAKLVGVTYKTVRRWLTKETDVSEESIRQVARALHIRPAELLVRVGLYDAAEIAGGEQPAVDNDDAAMRVILESNVPPRVQQRMIQRLQDLRRQRQVAEVDEVRFWLDRAGEG